MLNKLTGKFKKKRKRKKLIFSLKSSPRPYMWGWHEGDCLVSVSCHSLWNASVFPWFLFPFSPVSVVFKINLERSCLEMKGLKAIIDDVILGVMLLHRFTRKTPHFCFIFTTRWSPRGHLGVPLLSLHSELSRPRPTPPSARISLTDGICCNFQEWWGRKEFEVNQSNEKPNVWPICQSSLMLLPPLWWNIQIIR